MQPRTRIAVLVVAALLLSAAPAFAQAQRERMRGPGGPGAHPGPLGEFRRIARTLDLTAEQRDRIQDLVRSQRDDAGLREARRAAVTARRKVEQAMWTDGADRATVLAALKEAAAAAEAVALQRFELVQQIAALLDDGQRARLQRALQEGRPRPWRMRQRRMR